MSQQPYYPPQGQFPQQPVQQQPQQFAQPQYPTYPQQQAPQQFAQQPGYPPAQQAPQQQLAQGTLDAFFNQRSAGSGPGLTWSNKDGSKKPLGFWYTGVVARDVGNGDIEQQTNTQGIPQTFKDGSPKFQMKVPLKGIQAADGNVADFTDGEGTWYVKGQARDELTRAMAEAGCDYGVPKAGDYVVITLVQRRPSGQGYQPANVVQVTYHPANAQAGGQQAQAPATGAPSPAPEAPAQPAQPPAPPQVQQEVPQQPQYQQPAPPAAQPAPQQFQQQPPAPPAAPQGAPVQQAQPPVQQQSVPQPPPGLDPNAQAILSQLTQQQAS